MAGRLLALLLLLAGPASAQGIEGDLVVYNAGSLARPFAELLRGFTAREPGVRSAQENSGSLEAARKLTELGKIPDVLAVADYGVIPKLLIPRFTTWYATFARTALVLAYTPESAGARGIRGSNWYRILLRPGVRVGHSDPSLDPAGYRTLLVEQLAEAYYNAPGLARRLEIAVPARYIRPKSADLIALLQAGELDYAWEYEAVARQHRLPFVRLPSQINLGDPDLASTYARVSVRVPGAARGGADSVEFRGEPIVFALTIPGAAQHPAAAEAFVRYVFSPEGQVVLRNSGFTVMERPLFGGPGKPPDGVRGD
jgi:molybdate/tungstate transport system substrate-binding protein